jgi:hypothetical protein
VDFLNHTRAQRVLEPQEAPKGLTTEGTKGAASPLFERKAYACDDWTRIDRPLKDGAVIVFVPFCAFFGSK